MIDAEIRRLDRVVQTLVDFARPVEVQLREQDLRPVIGDVLALAADELTMRRVKLISYIPAEPLIANVDADLLKQAALNVIQNGAQAMPDGGRLEVTLEQDRDHGENRAQAGKPNGTVGGGAHPRRTLRCCALPMRESGFLTKSATRSSICTLQRRSGAAASGWQ